MTPEEFKKRRESDDDWGGITYEDIADCAKKWGLCSNVYTHRIDQVRYWVLRKAKTIDAEDYRPNSDF